MDLEKFNPTETELTALILKTKAITVTDLTNKDQLFIVKNSRIELKKARIAIEKMGKLLRQDALDFQKKVIGREKELIGIISPEEERLEAIEAESEALKLQADRLALLPYRKEELTKLGLTIPDDQMICAMDSEEFKTYCNRLIAEKNEAVRIDLEKRAGDIKKAEDELKRKEEIRIAEEKGREEERLKAEQRERDRIAKEEQDKEREKQRIAKEKLDAELREKAGKDDREKNERYQAWLKENGYTEETKRDFVLEVVGKKARLSKIIGIYSLE